MKEFYISCYLILVLFSCSPAFSKAHENTLLLGLSKNYEKVLVENVLSADLIQLDSGEKIRLIGLKAPIPPKAKTQNERDQYGFIIEKDTEPFATIEEQAFEFAKKLMDKKYVRIELDTKKKDENLITLGYVFLLDGTFVNEQILRKGFANLHLQPTNNKYADLLRAAYQEARDEKRGLQGE